MIPPAALLTVIAESDHPLDVLTRALNSAHIAGFARGQGYDWTTGPARGRGPCSWIDEEGSLCYRPASVGPWCRTHAAEHCHEAAPHGMPMPAPPRRPPSTVCLPYTPGWRDFP